MSEPLTMATPPTTEHTEPGIPASRDLPTPTPAEPGCNQLADLRCQLATAQAELTDARDELEAARKLRAIRESEFAEFKDRVARVAMSYAREHNWCSVVTDALDDLGLQPPDVRVNGEFTVTYTFTAFLSAEHHRDLSDSFVRDSLNASVSDGVRLDSDWSDADISVESVDVSFYNTDDED